MLVVKKRPNKPDATVTNPTRPMSSFHGVPVGVTLVVTQSFYPQRDAWNHVRECNYSLPNTLLKLTSDHKFREGLGSGQVCSRDTFVSAAVIVLRMLDCEFSIF